MLLDTRYQWSVLWIWIAVPIPVSAAVPRATGNICFAHVIIEENSIEVSIKVFQNGKKLSSKNQVCVSGLSENARTSQSAAYLSHQK